MIVPTFGLQDQQKILGNEPWLLPQSSRPSPQQGDPRLSGPPSGQRSSGGARTQFLLVVVVMAVLMVIVVLVLVLVVVVMAVLMVIVVLVLVLVLVVVVMAVLMVIVVLVLVLGPVEKRLRVVIAVATTADTQTPHQVMILMKTSQPLEPFWPFGLAYVIANKNCVTASTFRGRVAAGSEYIPAPYPDAICEAKELRDGWVKNNRTFKNNDYPSNLKDFQTNARSFRPRRHIYRTDEVKPTETWFQLHRNGHEPPKENSDLQKNSDISRSSSTNLDLNTKYSIDDNPKKAVSIQSGLP
ncbi:hypothetical protein PoB_006677500 [Plakobranchus ocellatus]|uniref:Uncharacterized protein n=1 Tax=Plakobranchus ocellatus TaxID=259542 RepID=A0AAV4D823_9GAST|nr:hypothetical protein PoB_006677500 [Plakobranchus ocellatus]